MMKKTLTVLSVAFCCAFLPAQEDVRCSDELLFAFFPREFVIEALAETPLSDDQIGLIAKELEKKDREIIEEIESRAAKMKPNPLLKSADKGKAIELFRDVLLEVYAKALQKQGIKDRVLIEESLHKIQQLRARRFEACMRKHQESAP